MKLIITLCALVLSLSVFATDNRLGLGAMFGNPTGLSGKYWLDDTHAVDAGMGLALGSGSDFSLHSDYLFHKEDFLYLNDVHPLDLYYGIGGRMAFSDSIEIGARVPVGVAYKINDKAADIFAEVAPILDFIGRQGLELHLLVGSRYFF
jgi:hypothetical protein